MMKITAIDIPPSDISDKLREHLLAAISKCKPEKTGGLASNITVAINCQYDIIANISVEDGLINGAECCVKYIQPQQNKLNFPAAIWVKCENPDIGQQQCKKYQNLYQFNKVNTHWTPIFVLKRTFLVKSVWVMQIQFPLCHAAARTIHISQGYIQVLHTK